MQTDDLFFSNKAIENYKCKNVNKLCEKWKLHKCAPVHSNIAKVNIASSKCETLQLIAGESTKPPKNSKIKFCQSSNRLRISLSVSFQS